MKTSLINLFGILRDSYIHECGRIRRHSYEYGRIREFIYKYNTCPNNIIRVFTCENGRIRTHEDEYIYTKYLNIIRIYE